MEPITIGHKDIARILRPCETNTLIGSITKRKHKIFFKSLLVTGMRYIELQRLYDHPGWFDGRFIHLSSMAIKKAKRKQKSRWVRLNPLGREIVGNFLDCDTNLPSWQTWRQNLHRWAEKAHLDATGLSPKTTRKTWESWLVFYYPDKLTNIVLSQGHTTFTAIQYYISLPFTMDDKNAMTEFLGGWL